MSFSTGRVLCHIFWLKKYIWYYHTSLQLIKKPPFFPSCRQKTLTHIWSFKSLTHALSTTASTALRHPSNSTQRQTDSARWTSRTVNRSLPLPEGKDGGQCCFRAVFPPAHHLAAHHLVHVVCRCLLLVHSPTCLSHKNEYFTIARIAYLWLGVYFNLLSRNAKVNVHFSLNLGDNLNVERLEQMDLIDIEVLLPLRCPEDQTTSSCCWR